MRHKISLWLGMAFILLSGFAFPLNFTNVKAVKRWIVSENSSLCVNGTTNINKFACDIAAYDRTDTINITEKNDDKITLTGSIGLSIKSFDCHNSMMTRNLRKTLKEDQFPLLKITFLSLSKVPELTAKPQPITGDVTIDLAGVQKRFDVSYRISIDAQNIIHLLGTRDVNFSDFNIVPPKKLGGMIKTNDKLSVQFQLNMKAID